MLVHTAAETLLHTAVEMPNTASQDSLPGAAQAKVISLVGTIMPEPLVDMAHADDVNALLAGF
jgi:hypothetical protein